MGELELNLLETLGTDHGRPAVDGKLGRLRERDLKLE